MNKETTSVKSVPKTAIGTNLNDHKVAIPVNNNFVFSHEPISNRISMPMFVRETELDDIRVRIEYSTGGAFLITGFRGVGKTSFINQALHGLEYIENKRTTIRGRTRVIPIYINLSRRMTPTEVMHHIIRQVYTDLNEKGIFTRFPSKFRKLVLTAYQRTAFSISYSKNKSVGQQGTVAPPSVLNIGWTGSKSVSQGEALEFLGYDDKSAEYDVIRILRDLSKGYRRFFRHTNVRPIIVFDEIDKLNLLDAEDKAYLLELISTLKAVLTTSGSIFIFIGGKDMYQVWMNETRNPDSIYESVFAYDLYLPCLWDLSDNILDHFIHRGEQAKHSQYIDMLNRHLSYKGRGIARRIIRELNKLVRWHNHGLHIVFDVSTLDRVRLFSDLEKLIRSDVISHIRRIARDSAQFDRLCQTAYYISDYIVSTDGLLFSYESLVAHFSDQDFYRNNRNLGSLLQVMLRAFLDGQYIELFQPKEIDKSIIEQPQKQYQLHPRIKDRLRNNEAFSDLEYAPVDNLPFGGKIHDYTLTRLIGQGGMSDVFEARHERRDTTVAIKVLRLSGQARWNQIALEIMERETHILSQDVHPNIVKMIEHDEIAETKYIVMEQLEGYDFRELVQRLFDGLSIANAIALFAGACEPISALHEQGFYRLDIKPDNFIVDTVRNRVVLIDVGTAISQELPTSEEFNGMIGTRGFMAPEVESPSEEIAPCLQSDIYSLGILLYLLVIGRRGLNLIASEQDYLTLLDGDDAYAPVVNVIKRATSDHPQSRYQSVQQMLNDLDLSDKSSVSEVITQLAGFASEEANGESNLIPGYFDDASTAFEVEDGSIKEGTNQHFTNITFGTEIGDSQPKDTSLKTVESDQLVPLISNSDIQVDVRIPDKTGVIYTFNQKQKIRIGRSSENEISIPDKKVSRHTATIQLREGSIILEVFRDTSPVFVNSNRVQGQVALSDGAHVELRGV